MKKALITGITGQDGSYLAELLLSKKYEVHGIIRRSSNFNTERIDHIYSDPHNPDAKMFLHYGDLSDSSHLTNLIYEIEPEEIYHLGAQSHVKVSFDLPEYSSDITGLGTLRILESIRRSGINCKFYQASSSEMFGSAQPPQNENTPFEPQSPYACAKLYSHWSVVNYRKGYDIFAISGILFNHESPRRGERFVTRKVTRAIANILAGKQDYLYLGNLEPKRDWGFAPEYVEVMYRLMQLEEPTDVVIGTGQQHSVKEFVEKAFEYVGLDWKKYVKIDKKYFRPTEVGSLLCDPSKAESLLNWKAKIDFEGLLKIMIDADMKKLSLQPKGEGEKIIKEKFPEKWWNSD
ncbi:MAG: GDP-mannose 4,6-dehydratase [Thermodesulfobacteriota bacterium]